MSSEQKNGAVNTHTTNEEKDQQTKHTDSSVVRFTMEWNKQMSGYANMFEGQTQETWINRG